MYEESSVFNSIERRQGKEETRAFFQLKQNTGERNNPYMRITHGGCKVRKGPKVAKFLDR